MKSQEFQVLTLIVRHPNQHYSDLFFWRGDVTPSQWYYWTKKLLAKGLVESIFHGHNRYGWTGYRATQLGKDLQFAEATKDIPF